MSKTLSTQSKGSSDVVSGVSRQQRKEDGNPPKELIAIAEEKGFCEPGTKAHVIVDWLKEEFAPHGFRNTGEVPLLVVSVHESPTLVQEFLGQEPA